jgi:hypothetical protein
MSLGSRFVSAVGLKHWKLQYASSLYAHKDWKRAWGYLTPGQGHSLALLGNCCSVATPTEREYSIKFLRECSKAWQTVYVVPGPHELSSTANTGQPFFTQLDTLKGMMKDASGKRENVYLMQHGEHSIPNKDIVVLSATAWTGDVPFQKEDGRAIYKLPSETATEGMFAAWHQEDIGWLQRRCDWWGTHHPDVRKIVLTHYHPYFLSNDERDTLNITTVWGGLLGRPFPYAPFAWLSGANNVNASGILGRTFLAANGLFGTHGAGSGGETAGGYMGGRTLDIPLRRGQPAQVRPTGGALALLPKKE